MTTRGDYHAAMNVTRPGKVAIAAILALIVGCEKPAPEPPPARQVFTLRVADASGFAERGFPGRARAGQEVNRSFRVSGPLIEFPVTVGDQVSADDLLARIDPQDFLTTLGSLEGQLRNAQASYTRAQADFQRVLNVYNEDSGAISDSDVDGARQQRDSAAAKVASLRAAVQNAEDQLSYTSLAAPFDGVVVETYVENYETVVARQPVLRLLDPSSIEFVVNVPENLIGLAPYVTDVTVRFDALPGTEVPAEISEIGREASQATRTYPVTLRMEQPKGVEILPGMAGTATIVSRPPEGTTLVGMQIPATAVFAGENMTKSFVWVVDESSNTLERREIEVGSLAQFGVLVRSGLRSGDLIVTKGVNTLSEGEEVRIMQESVTGETS